VLVGVLDLRVVHWGSACTWECSVFSTTQTKGICYWRSKMYFCSKVEFVDGISWIYEVGTTVLVQWWESLAQGKFILGLINVICFHVWCGLSLLVLFYSLQWFLLAIIFNEHQHFDLISFDLIQSSWILNTCVLPKDLGMKFVIKMKSFLAFYLKVINA